MQIRSTLTGWRYFGVNFVNILLLTFTLGLGWAWVLMRDISVRLNSVQFRGDPELASLLQDTKAAPKTGEGLLEALDMDLGF